MHHPHDVTLSPDRPRVSHPHGRPRLRRIALAAGLCLTGFGLPGLVVTASATGPGEPETGLSAPASASTDQTIADLDAELIAPVVVQRAAG